MSSYELEGRQIKLEVVDPNAEKTPRTPIVKSTNSFNNENKKSNIYENENKLFLGNLDFEATEPELRSIIEERVGTVGRIDLVFDKETSK